MIQLKDYQLKCANEILSHKHTIVQMGTGTGKTYTALYCAKGRTVIICTNVTSKAQWEKSITNLSKDGCTYEVYTYSNISKGNHNVSGNIDTLIFDEAHNITSTSSNRTRKIRDICKTIKPEYIFALSATPIKNDEKDYYTIQRVLGMDTPLTRHFGSMVAFQQWCYEWGTGYNHFRDKVDYIPKYFKEECKPELVRQSNIVFYEFTNRFKIHKFRINFTKASMDVYKFAEKYGVLDGYHRTFGAGSKVFVLAQLTNSTFKFTENNVKVMDNDYIVKINAILDILNKHDKILVIYTYNAERAIIEAYNAYYDVYTKPKEFKKAKRGILLRQASRSSSEDIPYSNTIVWFSMNFSGVDLTQMHGRVSRMNSEYDELYYYYLIFENTIETLIYDVACGKMTKNELNKLYE